MKNTKLLSAFGWAAILEGISTILLFANMLIVKRMDPEMGKALVYPIGMVHGLLFVAYTLLLIQCKIAYRWSLGKSALYFLLSFVPFGTFWVDKKLKEEKKSLKSLAA